MRDGWVWGRAPATIANVGPGFDVFALAIHGPRDEVAIRPADKDSLAVEGVGAASLPTKFSENTAGIVIDALRAATGISQPLQVRVRKEVRPSRGLGRSPPTSCLFETRWGTSAVPRRWPWPSRAGTCLSQADASRTGLPNPPARRSSADSRRQRRPRWGPVRPDSPSVAPDRRCSALRRIRQSRERPRTRCVGPSRRSEPTPRRSSRRPTTPCRWAQSCRRPVRDSLSSRPDLRHRVAAPVVRSGAGRVALIDVPHHLVELVLGDLAARVPPPEDLGRAVRTVVVPSVHRVASPAPPTPAPEQAAEQEEQEEDEDEEPEREEEEREVANARARSDDCPHDEADHNCDADQEEERCDPPTDEPSMPNDFTIRLHACHGGPHRDG